MTVKSPVRNLLAALAFVLACAAPSFSADAVAAPLTEEAARSQALGLVAGGRIVKSETETRKNGRTYHSYVVVSDDTRAKVTFDADTGEMIRLDRKSIDPSGRPVREVGDAARDTKISSEEAQSIALEKSGGGDIVKFEKEYKKNGRVIYEIEIISGDMEHEVELDANTGAILEYKSEILDDDDWHKKRRIIKFK